MTPRKIKEAVEATASLKTVQRLIKKCAHLSRRRLKKKKRFDSKGIEKIASILQETIWRDKINGIV
jgi:hypothetical protein